MVKVVVGEAVEVGGGGTAPPNWASNSAKSSKLENLKGEGRFVDPKMPLGCVKGLPWEASLGVPAGLGRGLTGNRISRNRGGLVVVVVVVVVVLTVVLDVLVVVVVVCENFDVTSVDFCLAFTLTLLLSPDFFFPTTFLLFTMAGL